MQLVRKVLPAVAIWFILSFPAPAQVSVTTYHYDNLRTGQNIAESLLTPSNVNTSQFGKLFSQSVDGQVYAQPLYLPNITVPNKGKHNIVYVATEHDGVYAFDADSNTGGNKAPLWRRSFINPASGVTTIPSSDQGCGDLTPEIGITGTPVIDSTTKTIYLVAATKEHGRYIQRLHAMDAATGKEKFGGPVVISAAYKGSGDGSTNGVVHFDALREHQRAGLLLQNGNVSVGWASHCDFGPYHGWVISFDAKTLAVSGVHNSTPDAGLGGYWAAGAGLAGDASYNTYFASGNGTFDADQGGRDYGDTILKLAPPVNKHFKIQDYFTPYNQQSLSDSDLDLGSGGVLLLPDQTGPHSHLLIQGGKEGTIYLIDRDNMGHYNPDNNSQIVQSLPSAIGGIFSTAAFWNNNVYFGGIFDYVRQFTFNTSTGLLSTSSVSQSSAFFRFPGPTPVVSANGTSNGIVWVLQTDSSDATLRALDANNLNTELYNSGQNSQRDDPGNAIKFTAPIVANGKVYVPADKQVSIYGLLSQR
jgi:hypothetical protein